MIVDIYIGTFKIDTFKDEGIEINSSIADINDISANTTDYSKSFTIPASHNNNKIFKHYYNANIDNTFDARTKVNGRIELGGIPFKEGKFRLEKVNVKKNKPESYTINFRGNLVSLKDKFKEDELSSLDFSEYNHLYNSANIKTGLESSLFSGNIIYNLLYKKQLYYNSDPTDNTNTPTLGNIAWGGGVLAGVRASALKPSIKVKRIIEKIESTYGITFSSDFFGRAEFEELYLWLNNETTQDGLPTQQKINFEPNPLEPDFGFNFTTDTWNGISEPSLYYQYQLTINPVENVPYKVIVKNFGVPILELYSAGGGEVSPVINVPIVNGLPTAFSLTFHLSSSQTINYVASIKLIQTAGFIVTDGDFIGVNNLINTFDVSANFPQIKIIDFLKGLFQMFKLVVIAEKENEIYVNTLNDYYAEGKLVNLTKYIDFESYNVERGNILNKINFNFEEPTTLLNQQFKKNTSIAYGDEEIVLEDEDGNILDGTTFDVKLPFEQIVYERLKDLDGNGFTNIMYGGVFDESIQGVNPKPHLFYNINTNLGSKPLGLRNDSNVKVQVNTLNVPSHTFGFTNPQFSLLFGQEFNEWDGQLVENTLYSNYYREYINSIFNIKRRTFRFNAKQIPLRILTKLKLNDIIQIRNDYYRIDNYNTNLLNGETGLTLINSFNNNISAFVGSRSQVSVDFREQRQSIYVTGKNLFLSYTSLWCAVTNEDNNVYFDFDQNATGLNRDFLLTIINTDNGKKLDIYVSQFKEENII
jgi:hypothetical protein